MFKCAAKGDTCLTKQNIQDTGWQKLCGGTGGPHREVWIKPSFWKTTIRPLETRQVSLLRTAERLLAFFEELEEAVDS